MTVFALLARRGGALLRHPCLAGWLHRAAVLEASNALRRELKHRRVMTALTDPAFAPDGKLYFISNRPKDQSDTIADYDIWFVAPLADGRWSAPENLKSIN